MIVLALIGYRKGRGKKPGLLVRAFVEYGQGGSVELAFSSSPGQYLTTVLDKNRGQQSWYMCKQDLSPGDRIRFDVYTGYKQGGEDPTATLTKVLVVDPSVEIAEYKVLDTGPAFLCKGRLRELTHVTKRELLDAEIEGFLDDTEGM